MHNKIIITTNKSTADCIQKFFNSSVSERRSIRLEAINHNPGYSDVVIGPSDESEKIKPEDIFWMGYYTYMKEINNQ